MTPGVVEFDVGINGKVGVDLGDFVGVTAPWMYQIRGESKRNRWIYWLYMGDLRRLVEEKGGKVEVRSGAETLQSLIDGRRELLALKVGEGLGQPDAWWEGTFTEVYTPWLHQRVGAEFMARSARVLNGDDVGLGKAQPVDALVLTTQGWCPIGALGVGSMVVGASGYATMVTGVFPQGKKMVFRVTFSDGSSTECCDDHLWATNTTVRRSRGCPPKIRPLKEIRKDLFEKNGARRHFIPMVGPVQYRSDGLREIDPYLLGALIGDGSLSGHSVVFSSADMEMIHSIERAIPEGCSLVRKSTYDWRIRGAGSGRPNPLIDVLRGLGLMGKRSEGKYIPKAYRQAPVEDRIALLQGLLDTDGHVRPVDNNVEYCTVSQQLAVDVAEVIRSLGGVARINEHPTPRQLAYRMSVILPNPIAPFRLSRKAEVYKGRQKYGPSRAIVSVEPVGFRECLCISVAAEDGLYVTEDFIVTHNTLQAVGAVEILREWGMAHSAVVFTTATAKRQWRSEVRAMLRDPGRVVVIEGDKAQRQELYRSPARYKILNYELVHRDLPEIERLFQGVEVVILDEAGKVKTRSGKTSKGLRKLSEKIGVPYRFALSATPLENQIDEIWAVCNFLDPAVLLSFTAFSQTHMDVSLSVQCWRCKRPYPEKVYVCPKCKAGRRGHPSRRFLQVLGVKEPERLKGRLAHMTIRRTAKDLGWKLPTVTSPLYWVAMNDAQKRAYKEEVTDSEEMVLARLSRATMISLATDFSISPLAPVTPKVSELIRLLKGDLRHEKVIVFTQSQKHVRFIEAHVRAAEVGGVDVIDGHVKVAHRDSIREAFNAGKTRVLVANAAAEEALNLQGGSVVVNLDLPWNPKHYTQRVGRVRPYLGGEDRLIRAVTILSRGTIEEAMYEKVQEKLGLFGLIWGDHGVDLDEVFSQESLREMLRAA